MRAGSTKAYVYDWNFKKETKRQEHSSNVITELLMNDKFLIMKLLIIQQYSRQRKCCVNKLKEKTSFDLKWDRNCIHGLY